MISVVALALLLPSPSALLEATPKDTVNAFVRALRNSYTSELNSLLIGASSNTKLKQVLSKYRGALSEASISNLRIETKGDRAQAKFNTPVGRRQQVADKLELKRVGNNWMVIPPVSPDDSELSSISWFASILADPAKSVWAVNLADLATCVGNAKELGTSMVIFMVEHDGVFKFAASQAGAMGAIKPLVKNESFKRCPTTGKPYTFNTRLAGKSADDLAEPDRTVMFYEGSNEKLNFAHDDKATVIFADRGAKLVTAEEAKRLRWKP